MQICEQKEQYTDELKSVHSSVISLKIIRH